MAHMIHCSGWIDDCRCESLGFSDEAHLRCTRGSSSQSIPDLADRDRERVEIKTEENRRADQSNRRKGQKKRKDSGYLHRDSKQWHPGRK